MLVTIKFLDELKGTEEVIFSGLTTDENFEVNRNAAMLKAAASVGYNPPYYERRWREEDYTKIDFGSWRYFLKLYEEKEMEDSFDDFTDRTRELSELVKEHFVGVAKGAIDAMGNVEAKEIHIQPTYQYFDGILGDGYLDLLNFLFSLQANEELKEKIKGNVFLQEKYNATLMWLEDAIANLAFLLVI